MKDPNCTPCQEWELCPFHPADELPATERLSPLELAAAEQDFAYWMHREAYQVRDPLSAEAQAVLDGLKQAARSRQDIRQALVKAGHCAAGPEPACMTIGGLSLQRSDCVLVAVGYGLMRITLPFGSERQVKLNAMFIADQLAQGNGRPAWIAIDAPALGVRTDRAWFQSRSTDFGYSTYFLRFVP